MNEVINTLFSNKLRTPYYWVFCCSLFTGNFYYFLNGLGLSLDETKTITHNIPEFTSPFLILIGLAAIPRTAQDSIAHFKIKNPLPGAEAFSRWAKVDKRISLDMLKQKLGKLPTKKSTEQNSIWYELYKTVKSDSAVFDSHKKYILFRDMTVLHSLWIALNLIMSFPSPALLGNLILLALAYFVLVQATNNSGIRFVQNVLAAYK